jgi:hypothetical protein
MYTLIHPTKCGGTSFGEFIRKHYSDHILWKGHIEICSNENNPIIIIRDPVERFISMFNYWKNGSNRYKRHTTFINKYNKYTIKDFINLLKNNDTRNLYQQFTWNQHFSSYSEWIDDTDYKNIVIIKYCSDLNEKIDSLLDYLKIDKKSVQLDKINVSKKDNVVLDKIDMTFIKERYKFDFDLYHKKFYMIYMNIEINI